MTYSLFFNSFRNSVTALWHRKYITCITYIHNCCQINRFSGKTAVSILSEPLQLPPNNGFVKEELQESHRPENTF